MKMMVLGDSVTSTPNGSLASLGVSALGAGLGGGGESDAAGGVDCAKAAEATPSATNAARVAVRQSEIIEVSSAPRCPAQRAGIAEIYHGGAGTVLTKSW